jgi:two-component system sensor histidine kinase KdpD
MRMERITRDAASPPLPPAAAAGLLLPYVAALAMVAISTMVGTFIAPRWGNSPVDLLYLPTILAAAVLFGLWPALAAGLASALAYNFYFTPPFHTFRMDRPADIVTVVILFIVAAVTSKLTASVREQAALANAHASRNATIAGFAARLLSCRDRQEIGAVACRELSQIFACNSIILEGLPRPAVLASEPAGLAISPSEIATAASVLESGESAGRGARRPYPTDWQFSPVRPERRSSRPSGLSATTRALPWAMSSASCCKVSSTRLRLRSSGRGSSAKHASFRRCANAT